MAFPMSSPPLRKDITSVAVAGTTSATIPPSSAPTELRRALADIKRQHVNRKHWACAAQCGQILASIQDPASVEPLHLISIHFYAAISIELCARPLASSLAGRAAMLAEARDHLAKASELVQAAEDSVARRLRPLAMTAAAARLSSQPPARTARPPSSVFDGRSCPSPAMSTSSRVTSWWTCDAASRWSTPMSSPANSVYSFEDVSCKSPVASGRVAKKVSFSPALQGSVQDHVDERTDEHVRNENTKRSSIAGRRSSSSSSSSSSNTREERTSREFRLRIIRPDSPTLGFDDKYFQDGAARQKLPGVPLNRRVSGEIASAPIARLAKRMPAEAIFYLGEDQEHSHDGHDNDDDDDDDDDDDTATRPSNVSPAVGAIQTFHRYCEQLAGLRTRLAHHSESLDHLLEPRAKSEAPSLSDLLALSGAWTDDVAHGSDGRVAAAAMRGDLKVLDRQARVERLRACGWQRRRFDAGRYQDFCERVSQEMRAGP